MKGLLPILIFLSFSANAQSKSLTLPVSDIISVTDFGAHPGNFDNSEAFKRASDFIIQHPNLGSNLYIPPGNYFESKPWVIQSVVNGKWDFFHIRIFGNASAKSSPDTYLTTITCGFTDGFGIGVQFGRDVEIENIALVGKYQPPPISEYNIGSTLYSAWSNKSGRDTRKAPYCGIAIDPFCDINQIAREDCYGGMLSQYLPNSGRGGTSGMKITKCRINNFPVGIILTPNGYTQNDENVNILDDNIYACKVAIAICQDQSKAITIEHLKAWGPTYTILEGMEYGAGMGGGSTHCYDWNIAGCVNQLFNVNAGRFPLSGNFINAESLFRIGFVHGMAGFNLSNCNVDLLTGNGMPAADYIFSGGPLTWTGGMLRYYDGSFNHRMNLSQMNATFKDMTMTNYPMITGLYAYGINGHPTPVFENINLYYGQGKMKKDFESLTPFPWLPNITIDKEHWIASFTAPPKLDIKVGDYILASPTDKTGRAFDKKMNPQECSTIQIGRVIEVKGDNISLDDVGLNAYSGKDYGAIYIDRIK
jgi:hypothetical protein